jgi:sugar-specific transcriptional regulator TrmB
MAKPLLDSRYQLFHKEMIKNENELRLKWFVRNQQRLIDNLGEPRLIKRAKDVIEESEKRMRACVDKPIVRFQ